MVKFQGVTDNSSKLGFGSLAIWKLKFGQIPRRVLFRPTKMKEKKMWDEKGSFLFKSNQLNRLRNGDADDDAEIEK